MTIPIPMTMEKTAAWLALFFSALFLFRSLVADRMRAREARSRLGSRVSKKMTGVPFFNVAYPFIQECLPFFQGLRSKVWERFRRWLETRLVQAGLDRIDRMDQNEQKMEVEEFWGLQVVMSLLLPLVFGMILFSSGVIQSSLGRILLIVLLAGIGWFYPLLWLRGRILRRQEEIRLAMAPAVDLISLSVEAGLDFIVAIGRYVERSKKDPLAEELTALLHEIRMGASRQDALRNLANRVDEMTISSFCAVLIQADRLGTSIGPALKAQADKIRTERFQAAERLGAAASQKILFPLVFFIIPAVFIVIFAPIVIQFMTGGLGGSF